MYGTNPEDAGTGTIHACLLGILPAVFVLSSEERQSDRKGVRLIYCDVCTYIY